MDITNLQCCAVKELSALSAYKTAHDAARMLGTLTCGRQVYDSQGRLTAAPWENFRYIVFTQANVPLSRRVVTYNYGDNFAEFIAKERLGVVLETGSDVNPNTGNYVKVWIWSIDHTAFKAWLAKEKFV